MNLDLKQH